MSFRKGTFGQQEPERKALREKMRKAFFADLGVTPTENVLGNEVDLKIMAQKRADAMATARAVHEDDTGALDMMEAAIGQLGFGLVPPPPGRRSTPNLKALSVMNMRNFFYTYRG